MIQIAWIALLGVSALSAQILFVMLLRRRIQLNLAIIGSMIVLLAEFPSSFNIASVGGMSIAFMDVYSVALLVIFALHFSSASHSSAFRIFFVFAILLGIAIVAGGVKYGLAPAFNESRQFLWMVSCVLWSTTINWRSAMMQRRLLWLLVLLGWFLVAIAVIRMINFGLSAYGDDLINAAGEAVDGRILISGQALMLLFSLMAALALSRAPGVSKLWIPSACVFVVVLVLSQQRTVWAVAMAAATIALLVDRRRKIKEFIQFGFFSLVIGILWAVGSFDAVLPLLADALQDRRTYDGRNDGWMALMAQAVSSGPVVVLFGEPFGFGYARVEVGRLVLYSPHNWYLTIFLRLGLVGLVLYCTAVAVCLVRLLRNSASHFLVVVVAALCVYSWTYSTPWYAAVLLGAAFVQSGEARRRGNAARIDPLGHQSTRFRICAEDDRPEVPMSQ